MDFTFFSEQISKIKDLPLLGEVYHFKMAPESRIKELRANRINMKNAKKAAVMALFYPNEEGDTYLLLILRKTYKGVHSNQIALPGGKVEYIDTGLQSTALRETEEEVGVPSNKVTVIRSLSKVYIPPSNFEVQPFVGLYKKPSSFVRQESEVEALVPVSLVDFLDDSKIIEEKLKTSYSENITVPAFKLNGYTVWGATAMILSEIKDLLKQVL